MDARSPDDDATSFTPDIRWTLFGIFLLLLAVMLALARSLLLPFVCAAVLAFMLGPLAAAAKRVRVPAWLFALGVVLLVVGALNALVMPSFVFMIDWVQRLPELVETLERKLHPLMAPFDALKVAAAAKGGLSLDMAALAQSAFTFVTPSVGELIIFLAALFFLLTSRTDLRRYLVFLHDDRELRLRTLKILDLIENDLKRYAGMVTAINFTLAFIVAVVAWIVGLPNPPIWGVVTFIMEFLPYVGPTVIFSTLLGAGVLTFDSPGQALIAPFVVLTLDLFEVHFVTPAIIGREMDLAPGVVFVSVVFWAWLWGPVGAFLATPLLIVASATMAHLSNKHEPDLP